MLVVFSYFEGLLGVMNQAFHLYGVKCVQLMCMSNPPIHNEDVPISLEGCKYNAVKNSKDAAK